MIELLAILAVCVIVSEALAALLTGGAVDHLIDDVIPLPEDDDIP